MPDQPQTGNAAQDRRSSRGNAGAAARPEADEQAAKEREAEERRKTEAAEAAAESAGADGQDADGGEEKGPAVKDGKDADDAPAPRGESRYSFDKLVQRAEQLLHVSPHVVAAALHTERDAEHTLAEAEDAVKRFLEGEVE